jgi:anti-sigma regulatory factor (Ser/Thr protein kinase)
MPLVDVHHGLADAPHAMRWRRTFPGRADQSSAARNFVAFLLAGCPLADDVVSVVAELVANTLRHTRSALPGGLFLVEVRRWRGGVAVAVTDQGSAHEPAMREADEMAESGRGLQTVEALASRWGWTGDPSSRTVTAVFNDH